MAQIYNPNCSTCPYRIECSECDKELTCEEFKVYIKEKLHDTRDERTNI